jgi:hypothetical protein
MLETQIVPSEKALEPSGALNLAKAGLEVIGLRNVVIPPDLADGDTVTVDVPRRPRALLVFGSISSRIGRRGSGLLPHGGVTQGFADLTKCPPEQTAYGTLAAAVTRTDDPSSEWIASRFSAIGPNGRKDAVLPNGQELKDLHGVAIGTLALGDYQRIVLVRVTEIGDDQLTLMVRRADAEFPPPEPVFEEVVDLTLVLFG